MGSHKEAYDRWTNDRAQALLSIYSEDDIQLELVMVTNIEQVYIKILAVMHRICIILL